MGGGFVYSKTLAVAVLYVLCVVVFAPVAFPQQMSNLERGQAQDILQVVATDIRKHYYDPKYHGVDWDAMVEKARQQIDAAPSMNMAISYIAAALDTLNDSHTAFFPPERMHRYYYGWRYQMIGERCYIIQVRAGTDADKKGVKPGDEVLTINGFLPDRKSLWKMEYVLETLRPQQSVKFLLQVPPDGKSREVELVADVTTRKRPTDLGWVPRRDWEETVRQLRPHYVEMGDELMILKLPSFYASNAEVAGIIGRARNHKTLILDLRGDPGGLADTVKYFVGALFDHDIKIADRVMRKETKAWEAKPQHNVFNGKLIVLIDSESASGSEVLARLVQLEKRGTVFGDRSAGSVMESKYYSNRMGGLLANFYGEDISDADLIMTDGKSLEHVGVTPDEFMLPKVDDIVNGRDPVLARAAQFAGVNLTPEAAGKLFPYEWPSRD
jgi:carboxyl-terminal processing protease